MFDSWSIHWGWLLLDSCSTVSRSVEILLHTLFSHVLHISFILSPISSLFHYIHVLIWILCTPLIILDHLYVSRVKLYSFLSFCQSWQKWGEIVEKMWFLFKILHIRERNTFLCKGEMCFILLEGVLTSFFLYTSLVTMFTYIVLFFDIYIYMMMYVFFTYLTCVVSFLFLYTCFLFTCMQSIISVSY